MSELEAARELEMKEYVCLGCGTLLGASERTIDGGHVIPGAPPDHCGPVMAERDLEPLMTTRMEVVRTEVEAENAGRIAELEALVARLQSFPYPGRHDLEARAEAAEAQLAQTLATIREPSYPCVCGHPEDDHEIGWICNECDGHETMQLKARYADLLSAAREHIEWLLAINKRYGSMQTIEFDPGLATDALHEAETLRAAVTDIDAAQEAKHA